MKPKRRCWGIYRERPHSPGRVDDDAAILQAVAAALLDHDVAAELLPAEAADAAFEAPGAGIFAMCEREAILARLAEVVGRGVPVVNAPQAVRNSYRSRTTDLFTRCGVSSPASRIVATRAAAAPAAPLWVKRPDFHATQEGDVLFVRSEEEWRSALKRFAARGIEAVLVQDHVEGDLVKFYGIEGCGENPPWFRMFPHKDQERCGHAFSPESLRVEAFKAARALGVDVFGGDAIIPADGRPRIIDLNAWPSFSRCRAGAAPAIARHLAGAFSRGASTIHSPASGMNA